MIGDPMPPLLGAALLAAPAGEFHRNADHEGDGEDAIAGSREFAARLESRTAPPWQARNRPAAIRNVRRRRSRGLCINAPSGLPSVATSEASKIPLFAGCDGEGRAALILVRGRVVAFFRKVIVDFAHVYCSGRGRYAKALRSRPPNGQGGRLMATAGETRALVQKNEAARLRLLLAGGATALVGVLFWDGIANLWLRWGEQQELSHSYFIPLISLWLVWTNRDAVIESIGAPSPVGPALLGLAGLLLLLGKLTYIFLFQHIGLVVAIAGLTATFGGLSLLRITALPIAFLFFAVPPPYWVITVLSWKFQQMSSVIGVWMIQAMDIPVYLSGNIIDLGEYKLQVAEACSGLRYLFPFLSLGVMAAYLYRGPLWQRLIIVASTIPITIIMNSVRIAVTGALVQAYGTQHAEGALHFFEGWVVFLICLVALFGVIALLCVISKPRRNPLEALGAPELSPVAPSGNGVKPRFVFGAALAVIAAFFVLSAVTSTDSLVIPEREMFAGIPSELPDMHADVRPMDPTVAEVLGADDTIVVNLTDPDGGLVNLYLAYLDAQRDGRSWHSPRQCIPGGGWQITDHRIVKTTTPSGKKLAYNRLIISTRNHRQLVYYWYDQRGRKIANEFVMKFWLIVDAVTRKRSDGAMVRLIAPVSDAGGLEKADKQLQEMMNRMDAFLPRYVPN